MPEIYFIIFCAELGASVNAVDGIYWSCDKIQGTIVAAAGENKLCVWMRNTANGEVFSLLHQHCSGSVLILDCKLHWLPKCQAPILACACDDGNVHLFTSQLVDGQLSFVESTIITGHEDWVRTLSFTIEGIPTSHESKFAPEIHSQSLNRQRRSTPGQRSPRHVNPSVENLATGKQFQQLFHAVLPRKFQRTVQ